MWKDPKYTKGCVEVPPAGSKKLPAPDYTLPATETLRPHKDSTLTQLNLPLSFTATFGMSYLYIEATDGAGSVSLFGWIDSITQRSTSNEGITLNWTVDWWRSYSGSVTWGAGIVTKCTNGTYKRPYRTQPRYWTTSKDDMTALGEYYGIYMVYILVVETHNGVSKIVRFEFPCTLYITSTFIRQGSPGTTYSTLTLEECYNGLVDELLTSYYASLSDYSYEIIGCYASTIIASTWNLLANPWSFQTGTVCTGTVNGNQRSMIKVDEIIAKRNVYFSPSIMTDDMTKYDIVDYQGNLVGTIPYGMAVTSIHIELDIGVNGAYERILINSSAASFINEETLLSRAGKVLGLEYTLPCITIPITSNQWSAYLLGGQRDYDITSARIAADQKGVAGLESVFSSGIGGGIAGASAGPLGAVGGMLGAAIGQGIMTGVEYGLQQNFNDQLQDARDRLYANQQNGIMLTGGSLSWCNMNNTESKPKGAYLIKYTADSTSASEYSQDISLNGYDVNIPASSVSSFISTGGALRIANLTITGSIPPMAKTSIKSQLEAGVRIVENNPSGVVP